MTSGYRVREREVTIPRYFEKDSLDTRNPRLATGGFLIQLSNKVSIDALRIPFYSSRYSEGSMFKDISLI